MQAFGTGSSATGEPPQLPWWQRRRRWLEIGFWPLLAVIAWGLDTLIKYQQLWRLGLQPDDFRLITEQVTSAVAALVMVPVVLAWLNRFPIRSSAPGRVLLEQLAGSILFSFGHFTLLIALRILIHASLGSTYYWQGGLWINLLYEYQNDLGIYAIVVLIISAYTHIRSLRMQLREDTAGPATIQVQTGRGEAVIALADIDFLEAARNYVTVRSKNRDYLLRETMVNLSRALEAHGFLRTHRSYLVNSRRVAEIRARSAGNHEIVLEDGASVPLSRGYRDAVRAALQDLKA